MRIVIDHRERSSRVYRLLVDADDIEARVEQLEVGDYLVDGRVLVERKTFDDFAASIIDARIFRQASRLNRSALRTLIILEGKRKRGRLGREQLQGALVTLTLVFDLPLLRSSGPEETVWLLRTLSRQATRTMGKGLASRRWNPRDLDARRVHMLTALPNVGPTRARRLLERFGSLEAVMSATEEELASVAGIGDSTAEKIRAFVEQDGR